MIMARSSRVAFLMLLTVGLNSCFQERMARIEHNSSPASPALSVMLEKHCRLHIPDGYKQTFSDEKTTIFAKAPPIAGTITITKGDFANHFLMAEQYRTDGWTVHTSMIIGRLLFRRKGKNIAVESFRILYKDVKVAVTGADANGYEAILGDCLPPDLPVLRVIQEVR